MSYIIVFSVGYLIGARFNKKVKEWAAIGWNWLFHKITGL